MRRLFFIIVIVFIAIFIFRYIYNTAATDKAVLVAHGLEAVRTRAGIKRVELEGRFHAERFIELGLPTVIEFYADSCHNCRILHNYFKQFLQLRPDVAVRQIRLPNDWLPQKIWEKYKIDIQAIPHIIIYDGDGQLVAFDEGRKKEGLEFLSK